MDQIIILTTKEEFQTAILSTFEKIENEKKAHQPPKLYSINTVAKLLGKAHLTVKKLVKAGMIQTTLDGKITSDALNRYLSNKS